MITRYETANPEVIANKAYGGMYGNRKFPSGDGWKYCGRGCIQITFLNNYAQIAKTQSEIYGKSNIDFAENPDLMASFSYSIRSVVCFWIEKKLYRLADRGTDLAVVDAISKVINKHTDSLISRQRHFTKALDAFK